MGDRWVILDWKFNRCPLLSVPVETMYWLKAYRFFKQGFLPVSGGWLEQSAKFIQVMDFIEQQLQRFSEDARRK